MQISPLGPDQFGVTVTAFDCGHVDRAAGAAILDLLMTYKVVVLREQRVTAAQYERFMSLLGEPVAHVLHQYCVPRHRNILRVSNYVRRDGRPAGVREGGAYWHTDMSYLAENTVATSLYSLRVPSHGTSETHFVDCATAYRRLTGSTMLASLGCEGATLDVDAAIVVHRFGNRKTLKHQDAHTQALNDGQRATLREILHPLVLSHPKTREKSLYALAGTSVRIAGWPEHTSINMLDALEALLFEHAPVYRHVYDVGDLVIWDNLSTLHSGVAAEASHSLSDCRMLYRMNVNYLRS
ncbi:TauD/TfdA dioxygenase family protein [Burkholderia glumae]|uniref:TauD/TfdA dioxygenase family protein n=1 Tax=Burkholderia glumae TaxID=337 RepID=UPI0021518A75|nr:TauD/TfdA family dioxygenase [Burkholderia glumae]